MGGRRNLGRWIVRLGDLPTLGQLLYRLNLNATVISMMARGHVYVNPNWLKGERFDQKLAGRSGNRGTTRIDPVCHRHAGPDDEPLGLP